ncbi:hypothetical protein LX36DRAFT_257662 [Colletotrichum falcatum]|nr:hypothetical protein LX36DRAFT_257662 [Colletotrichum falcatum]
MMGRYYVCKPRAVQRSTEYCQKITCRLELSACFFSVIVFFFSWGRSPPPHYLSIERGMI